MAVLEMASIKTWGSAIAAASSVAICRRTILHPTSRWLRSSNARFATDHPPTNAHIHGDTPVDKPAEETPADQVQSRSAEPNYRTCHATRRQSDDRNRCG